MRKKPRLAADPFNEPPLTFIRDTRGEGPAPGHNTRGFIIGPETVKRGNIGNMDNTINNRDSIFKPGPKSRRGRPRGTGTKCYPWVTVYPSVRDGPAGPGQRPRKTGSGLPSSFERTPSRSSGPWLTGSG